MDAKWFKQRQKQIGVTAEDIGRRMGRDRTTVSHILTGRIKMSLPWAKAFAEVLQVPISDVLEHAGVADAATAQAVTTPGFADSEAAPFQGSGPNDRWTPDVAAALGAKPGVDVWTVQSPALALMGYLPGDFILVDTHQAELVKPGDTVLAQIYNNARATASTVVRKWMPPVLVGLPGLGQDPAVNVVDGVNVLIRGKVVSSWRVAA